jgi:protein-L-isoaspartate(D-aspartate) O-methyltransferase
MRWRRLRPRRWFVDPEATNGSPLSGEAAARERMIRHQLEARGIRDPDLLGAFRTVPRHRFVDESVGGAYEDRALPLDEGQTISQPYIVAAMTDAARPPRGWQGARALEIGTGSGYQAAILAELGAEVISIERHRALAERAERLLTELGYGDRVRVVVGDGSGGLPEAAPFDAIIVTAAAPAVPRPLIDQLVPDGGKLVMPIGSREHQVMVLVERRGDRTERRDLDACVFVPLLGAFGFAGD